MGYLKYADYQNAQKIRTYYMNLIDKVCPIFKLS